jgi:hypothetical protein
VSPPVCWRRKSVAHLYGYFHQLLHHISGAGSRRSPAWLASRCSRRCSRRSSTRRISGAAELVHRNARSSPRRSWLWPGSRTRPPSRQAGSSSSHRLRGSRALDVVVFAIIWARTHKQVDATVVLPAGFSTAIRRGQSAMVAVLGGVDSTIGTQVAQSVAQSYADHIDTIRIATAATGTLPCPPSPRAPFTAARALGSRSGDRSGTRRRAVRAPEPIVPTPVQRLGSAERYGAAGARPLRNGSSLASRLLLPRRLALAVLDPISRVGPSYRRAGCCQGGRADGRLNDV